MGATGSRSSALGAFSSRGWIGGRRRGGISRSTRRGVSRRAPRVSGHAPRVCGVCRPCDRRPFRRGVTRIHRRRRRELNATATRAAFFPRARAADNSSLRAGNRSRALARRAAAERVRPQTRARGAHAPALRPPPTPAWGCGRACWWRSAWRRRRCASRRARGRDPRGRDAGAPRARSSVPDEKRAPPLSFFCLAVASMEYILTSLATDGD